MKKELFFTESNCVVKLNSDHLLVVRKNDYKKRYVDQMMHVAIDNIFFSNCIITDLFYYSLIDKKLLDFRSKEIAAMTFVVAYLFKQLSFANVSCDEVIVILMLPTCFIEKGVIIL